MKKSKSSKRVATTSADAPNPRDARTLEFISSIAEEARDCIERGVPPRIELPLRSLRNVTYDRQRGWLALGEAKKTRTLTANTIKSFAQTLRLMAVSRTMVENHDFATKREAYYVSKNWGSCRFDEQSESDGILDDIEALASLHDLSREDLRFHAESHGGSVVGELVVVDRDPDTGESVEIDCRTLGAGAYTIPRTIDHLELRTDASFVLAIETGGMFQRLNNHRFWRTAHCILVEMAGVPSRAARRFVRRLSDEASLPVMCFTDCDPYGFANIYRTMKVGSGNAAHVNRFFCVPHAKFLGVTPQDILDYGLEDATHALEPVDVKRARDALDHDPFFSSEPRWIEAIEQLLEMGVRAEQQALAKWGLNYVVEEYLPRKLADESSFLP
jgi:DNA topoisomerase-6 subunit A